MGYTSTAAADRSHLVVVVDRILAGYRPADCSPAGCCCCSLEAVDHTDARTVAVVLPIADRIVAVAPSRYRRSRSYPTRPWRRVTGNGMAQ